MPEADRSLKACSPIQHGRQTVSMDTTTPPSVTVDGHVHRQAPAPPYGLLKGRRTVTINLDTHGMSPRLLLSVHARATVERTVTMLVESTLLVRSLSLSTLVKSDVTVSFTTPVVVAETLAMNERAVKPMELPPGVNLQAAAAQRYGRRLIGSEAHRVGRSRVPACRGSLQTP